MYNFTTITWSAHEALFERSGNRSWADRTKAAVPKTFTADDADSPCGTSERRITLLELLGQSLLIALRRETPAPSQPEYGADFTLRQRMGANVKLSDIPEWERR